MGFYWARYTYYFLEFVFKKMATHSSFLDNPSISHLKHLFVYISCMLNFINVFHNVNSTLYTITSFTASKKRQEIARNWETRWKLSGDLRLKRDVSQVEK